MAPLVFLVILGLVVAYALARPHGDVVIRVRGGRVEIRGRVAQAKSGRIRDFFTQFSNGAVFTVIYNYPRGDRTSPVRFKGSLSQGQQQQIRNFLINEL